MNTGRAITKSIRQQPQDWHWRSGGDCDTSSGFLRHKSGLELWIGKIANYICIYNLPAGRYISITEGEIFGFWETWAIKRASRKIRDRQEQTIRAKVIEAVTAPAAKPIEQPTVAKYFGAPE